MDTSFGKFACCELFNAFYHLLEGLWVPEQLSFHSTDLFLSSTRNTWPRIILHLTAKCESELHHWEINWQLAIQGVEVLPHYHAVSGHSPSIGWATKMKSHRAILFPPPTPILHTDTLPLPSRWIRNLNWSKTQWKIMGLLKFIMHSDWKWFMSLTDFTDSFTTVTQVESFNWKWCWILPLMHIIFSPWMLPVTLDLYSWIYTLKMNNYYTIYPINLPFFLSLPLSLPRSFSLTHIHTPDEVYIEAGLNLTRLFPALLHNQPHSFCGSTFKIPSDLLLSPWQFWNMTLLNSVLYWLISMCDRDIHRFAKKKMSPLSHGS